MMTGDNSFLLLLTMPMTKKIVLFYFAAILGIAVVVIACSPKKKAANHQNMLPVEAVVFDSAAGWGYNVLVGNKLFIHQAHIPAVQGNQAFASQEEARSTASLVIDKIVHGHLPSVTVRELDSLHIRH